MTAYTDRHRWQALLRVLVAAAVVVVAASPALGWAGKTHETVVTDAVSLVPASSLRTYLGHNTDSLRKRALIPDSEFKQGDHRFLEGPDHFINLETLSPEPTVDLLLSFPSRRDVADYYIDHQVQFRAGFLPWRIDETWLGLADALACDYERILFFAGILGHYAADATNPLHTTIHYDGWVTEGSETKELKGLHGDYETDFVDQRIEQLAPRALQAAQGAGVYTEPRRAIAEVVIRSWRQVEPLYRIAREHQGPGRFDAWEGPIGDLTVERLADAETFLSSLWLSAWERAGKPKV
jgi:hypothetical protein